MADVNDVEPANDNSESGNDDVGNDPAGEVDGLMAAISDITSGEKEPDVKKEEVKVVQSAAAKVEEKKEETKNPETDRGLERLAAKEKEVREARESFEKERHQYVKLDDLKLTPSAILQKAGIDSDVLMKTILYEKLPDGNPVKEKLEKELSKVLTDRKITELRKEMQDRDRQTQVAQANAKNYHETVEKIGTYVGKFKDTEDKSLPTLSHMGKENGDTVKELIIEELINDAALRFARGEDGDPITHEEAASRIEKRLARLAPLLSKLANENNTGSTAAGAVVGKKKTTVRPGPAQAKVQEKKSSKQELDELISNVLSGKK
jgi:hypothetical protein